MNIRYFFGLAMLSSSRVLEYNEREVYLLLQIIQNRCYFANIYTIYINNLDFEYFQRKGLIMLWNQPKMNF